MTREAYRTWGDKEEAESACRREAEIAKQAQAQGTQGSGDTQRDPGVDCETGAGRDAAGQAGG